MALDLWSLYFFTFIDKLHSWHYKVRFRLEFLMIQLCSIRIESEILPLQLGWGSTLIHLLLWWFFKVVYLRRISTTHYPSKMHVHDSSRLYRRKLTLSMQMAPVIAEFRVLSIFSIDCARKLLQVQTSIHARRKILQSPQILSDRERSEGEKLLSHGKRCDRPKTSNANIISCNFMHWNLCGSFAAFTRLDAVGEINRSTTIPYLPAFFHRTPLVRNLSPHTNWLHVYYTVRASCTQAYVDSLAAFCWAVSVQTEWASQPSLHLAHLHKKGELFILTVRMDKTTLTSPRQVFAPHFIRWKHVLFYFSACLFQFYIYFNIIRYVK